MKHLIWKEYLLKVYLNKNFVGILSKDENGGICFQYAKDAKKVYLDMCYYYGNDNLKSDTFKMDEGYIK